MIQFIRSQLLAASGYGESARSFFAAITEAGMDVAVIDDCPDQPCLPYQNYIKKPLNDRPVLNVTGHHHYYPENSNRFSMARTMFESDTIDANWIRKLHLYDYLLVPGSFNFDSFTDRGFPKERVFQLAEPVAFSDPPPGNFQFNTEKSFKFFTLVNRDTWYRKGLDLLLNAYYDQFSAHDDVCLVIKADLSSDEIDSIAEVPVSSQRAEIEIIDRRLAVAELENLYASVDCYVMPSRGEGVGRPYLYSMLAGVPVIGTGWSGNMSFMNGENAFLLKYRMKQAPYDLSRTLLPLNAGVNYAEADVSDLKDKLTRVRTDPEAAKALGSQGKMYVEKFHSYKAVCDRFLDIVSGIKPVSKSKNLSLDDCLYPVDTASGEASTVRTAVKELKNIVVYGSGQGAVYAKNWADRTRSIEQLVFIDRHCDSDRFLGHPIYSYKAVDFSQFDCVIVAVAPTFLPSVMDKLKSRCGIPVFYFGA